MSDENHETLADIVAEMRNGPCCWLTPAGIPQHSHDNELFYKFADRIEAAVEFTLAVETAKAAGEGFAAGEQSAKERSCKLGNAAAMREALEALVGVIDECNSGNPLWWHVGAKGVKPLKDARSALSDLPRNCDRPECATTKSAQDTWRKEDGGKTAYYEWLLATSTKGETNGSK